MNATLLAVLFTAAQAAPHGASFDCKKAATAVEKAICSDPGLAGLDGELAAAYRGALSRSARPENLREGQKSWLEHQRARCGSDVMCLINAYGAQIVTLDMVQEVTASFDKAPFVNPALVKDLLPWLSDQGDQVLAIGVNDAQESNRYFVDALKVEKRRGSLAPYVGFETKKGGADEERFGYRHLGRTTSGVDVILTEAWSGGTGVFTGLLLVTLRYEESGMSPRVFGTANQTLTFKRRRLVIRKLGEIPLGDRWSGGVAVSGNQIRIETDNSSEQSPGKTRVVTLDYQP